ncbi:MAG: pirin family protein [Lewinellaceae bacterium]|nr:pirin family protein [Saprospiraceae bacterium]MCB9329923.1 pirin family protein [Lewinellaceae bacterium]
MNRKHFLKKTLLGAAGVAAGSSLLSAKKAAPSTSTYDKLMAQVPQAQVGFNHLPNSELKTMKTVLHRADTRGHADHGWLNSHHTFSFANYYNPERVHFGVLRVLNDDRVAPGKGFGTHPHDNMEIISIPLEGDLEHKDSMGNVAVIRKGDVQVMSAGTGITHSEYNKNGDKEVKFLQIWVFPKQRNVSPRYDQITLDNKDLKNQLFQILSPNPDDDGVWVHQDAWFHMGNLEKGHKTSYTLKRAGNGVYAFVLDGDVTIEGQTLNKRDGFGIWDTEKITISADSDAKVLLMEVPMQVG